MIVFFESIGGISPEPRKVERGGSAAYAGRLHRQMPESSQISYSGEPGGAVLTLVMQPQPYSGTGATGIRGINGGTDPILCPDSHQER